VRSNSSNRSLHDGQHLDAVSAPPQPANGELPCTLGRTRADGIADVDEQEVIVAELPAYPVKGIAVEEDDRTRAYDACTRHDQRNTCVAVIGHQDRVAATVGQRTGAKFLWPRAFASNHFRESPVRSVDPDGIANEH